MTEQVEPRKLTGEAAWKAHLESVGQRNAAAKKNAALHPTMTERAAVARARRLKGE